LGNLSPTAFFEPVTIGGSKIQRASLSNYQNVIYMQFEIEDEILVSRANDIIPYVEENITKGKKQRK
jgi:DNA ligase (NAD+)